MSSLQNLSFDQGEDWIVDHTALEADGVTPINLTGATLALQIAASASTVLVAPNQVTYTVTNPASGSSVIWLPSSLTATLAPGVYFYTLRVTTAAGLVIDLNYGSWTVNSTAFSA